ncbi:DNA adenine methylase [Anaerobiospirillum succiniciproducens]|uniref:DNA adenine methylase n=1 Tax=Anaerobiospirillum succiniciproducens TaxID=13335 RepID=UPI00235729E0|nr:DNA adenine methylase [Anaerobiospirillum succiniciproducens]MCI6862770.1 DNA adenine methylase [Anaerobiospirillum succiniciproducens]
MSLQSVLAAIENADYELQADPILKWAGGKRQMLPVLLPKVPKKYGRYIEPFFGGGAMFFAMQPENAIIADLNPELINMYEQVAWHLEEVIEHLSKYENTKEVFYEVRAQDWRELPEAAAAARMIYLNRTCFNGLYRVNKKGQFNTSYGNYKNPNYCNIGRLAVASNALQKATIVCDSYQNVLSKYAKKGDFIFLDPPYLPISENANFKRYTQEVFSDEEHIRLAEIVKELYDKGCYVLLTNSNHDLVHELYKDYKIEVIPTRRLVSCRASTRTGEDILVTASKTSRN